MRQLTRPASPTKLINNERKRRLYENLKDEAGNIRPRWNTLVEGGARVVRDAVRSISNDCCCFCGVKVLDSKMDIDHYLPSSKFPYLAYCWENLIPTCKQCNQTFKNDFFPNSLSELEIIESCMEGCLTCHHIYNQDLIMELSKNDRIIDPSYDNVNDHLEFNPEFYLYNVKTPIGINTNKMFFDRDEVVRHLEGISNITKKFVINGCSKDVLDDIINLYGQEFYYHAFFDYWVEEQAAGRLR
ncbi:HNH endonuclease [Priestia flexa]|uniref:HNH endonuclease n=1 Tax=Priestia flexa TaxID=86664 RepID=UPI001F4C79D0|nr:HNH endonuclease [Priestia flexa]